MLARLIAFAVLLLFAAAAPLGADDRLPSAEKQKIERLIEHVRTLKGARFVRNDVEYDAATAARFLQGKWDANSSDIKTARQFIEKAASHSSTSGKPYLIRFKQDDAVKEVKSGDYLLETLKSIENPPPERQP
jgi:hypothetical protein